MYAEEIASCVAYSARVESMVDPARKACGLPASRVRELLGGQGISSAAQYRSIRLRKKPNLSADTLRLCLELLRGMKGEDTPVRVLVRRWIHQAIVAVEAGEACVTLHGMAVEAGMDAKSCSAMFGRFRRIALDAQASGIVQR